MDMAVFIKQNILRDDIWYIKFVASWFVLPKVEPNKFVPTSL